MREVKPIVFAVIVAGFICLICGGCMKSTGLIPDTIFLWGQPETTNSNFFRHAIEYAGYGPQILYQQDDFERFPGERSVEFYTVFTDLSGVGDPFVNHDTNGRVELHADANYQALGVDVGSTVWFGWSQLYAHIGPSDDFTDFQIRSQNPHVTGSPAAEFYVVGKTKELRFKVGPYFPEGCKSIAVIEEYEWYDFVMEFKYSYDNSGYVRIWAAKAGSGGEVLLSYQNVTAEILNTPTMHNGDTFINQYADTPEDRAAIDGSPHLRWGVYPWGAQSSFPASRGEYYRKYLGTVRIYVGNDGENAFNAVCPRPSGTVPSESMKNLAFGKPTKMSSRYGGGYSQFAVDGNTTGEGSPWFGTLAHTDLEYQPYIEIDLEKVSPISKIVIWNRTSLSHRLDGVNIIVSSNPLIGRELSAVLKEPDVWSTTIPVAEIKNVIDVPSIKGRYIRLQLPTRQYLQLAEIEVY